MAMDYHRALLKLKFEHELDLNDPDGLLEPVETNDRYKLLEDFKTLWTEDKEKWPKIYERFGQEIRQLESNWVQKPNGDPKVFSQVIRIRKDVMVQVLKRLIEEEKSRFIPQSTMPFSVSQQELLLAVANEDLQGPSQTYTQSRAVNNRLPDSSLETIPAPSSSFIEALRQLEPDAYAFQTVQASAEYHAANAMVVDHQASIFVVEDDSPDTKLLWKRGPASPIILEDDLLDPELPSKKRPASPIILEDDLPKRKSDNRYPHQTYPVDNHAEFSFNNGRESPRAGNISRSLSRTTTGSTSFRSVGTEVNESFVTESSTPPSFGIERSKGISITCKEKLTVLTKSQRFAQGLVQNSPFITPNAKADFDYISYRVAHEIFRVALHNSYNASELLQHVKASPCLPNDIKDVDDLAKLWKVLRQYVQRLNGTMPAKTSEKVWKSLILPRNELQYSSLSFTGTINFGTTTSNSLLNLRLNPITIEKSNRLKRKYGSDRLIVLTFPSLEAGDIPSHLKRDAIELRHAIIDWLTTTEHYLMGRHWRAFYVKSKPTSKASEKKSHAWSVYLFAIDELTSLDSMLKWFYAFEDNSKEYLLKLFSRIQLSISDTTPTVMFKEGDSKVDQLEIDPIMVGKVFELDDIHIQDESGNSIMMTDGCGRISLKAAEKIYKKLGLLPPMPSAFQARIAGAKGMWIVEPNQSLHKDSDLWIEIRKSQKKFESLSRDRFYVDTTRITFEINEFSRPLRSAPLNFQLLQILIDRGVKGNVFIDLLREDLDFKVADLESAMSDGQGLRAWNQEEYSVAEPRINADSITWEGGMPAKDAEQINALTEAGFAPITCPYLLHLCRSAVKLYCTRVEERIKIYPGKTTYAFMVPDFYGVLEENQIHIGFSTAFIDKRLQWSDTMLHEIDVLVARLPAALPSDIHKVRAVFRPELAHLKDVVVFPTKGRFCLADKLSGGDYDGDRAWVCWNEAIVKAFKNFDAPKKQDPAHYGIQKDGTRIQDILNLDADTRATQFIKAGFEFNMRKSLLGRCTNMHEDFCYKLVVDAARNGWNMGDFFSPMSDRRAMDFANLLGYLVDTAKNGYTFTEHNYDVYLKSIAANNLPDPAYKRKNGAKATNHVIDQIVLVEALNFRQKALRKLDQITGISSVTTRPPRDGDLTRLFKDEKDTAKDDPVVSFILSNLKKDIDYLVSKWDILVSQRRNGQISWSEVHNSIREHFTNIIPAKKSENGLDLLNHSLVQRWHLSTNEESPTLSTHNSWSLLKASACYTRTSIGPLPWRACGKELMALKVLANQNGVSISNEMHQYFKLDRRMWETAKLIRSEREEMILGGELTRFDEDEFMSQVPEEIYEWQANAE